MYSHKQVKTLTAPQAARTATESKQDSFPSGRIYRAVLKVAVTVTQAAGAAAGTLVEDAPYTYLEKVVVTINGREVVNSRGQDLFNLATLLDGVAPTTTAPSGSLNAAHAFACELPIYFAPPESVCFTPEAALLASHGKLNPQLSIDYGLRTQLLSGGDGTFTISAESATLSCDFETAEIDPALYCFLGQVQQTISAAQDDFPVDLPFGDGIRYRFVMLRSTRAGVRSNTQIERVRLKAGEAVIWDQQWSTIQAENRRFFGIAAPTGIAVIYFDRSRRFLRLLDTTGLGQLRLELKVIAPSGTTNVTVTHGTVREVEKLVSA